MKTIFEEACEYMKENYNQNFHYNMLDWCLQEWIKAICRIVEERIKNERKRSSRDNR
jgi:hypothetical protein